MCLTCRQAESLAKSGVEGSIDKAFGLIELALRRGVKAEHFDVVSDLLLQTEMAPRDLEVEERWQEQAKKGENER